jgi:uncharacterized RDD family membrane protein YckC
LPETGPGSPASWPRRFGALFLDWAAANLVGFVLAGGAPIWQPERGLTWVPLVCWYALVTLFTAFTGASIGQRLLGVRVIRLDRQPVGLPTAAIRTFLIMLVIPPLVFTKEGRGLHDLATNTAAVNGPGRG